MQVVGAAWCVATRTMAGVGDLVQRTGDGHTGRVLGGWAVERSGGAVCGLHVETWSSGFLVEPQNQGGGAFPGLGLKTGSSGLVIWASKSPRRFLGLGLKTKWASVCRLRHKTDGGRSARVSQSGLKTGGGATTGGARGTIAEVASEAS
jgi:hypothetical protein